MINIEAQACENMLTGDMDIDIDIVTVPDTVDCIICWGNELPDVHGVVEAPEPS